VFSDQIYDPEDNGLKQCTDTSGVNYGNQGNAQIFMGQHEINNAIDTFCNGRNESPFTSNILFKPGCENPENILTGKNCAPGSFYFYDVHDSEGPDLGTVNPITITVSWGGPIDSGCPPLSFDDKSLNPGGKSASSICKERLNVPVNSCEPYIIPTVQILKLISLEVTLACFLEHRRRVIGKQVGPSTEIASLGLS
jgi:hypothetical protein